MNKVLSILVRVLGACTTRKSGEEYIFTCPECGRDKLEVNIRKMLFHCFRCSFKGRVKRLLKSEVPLYLQDPDAWFLKTKHKVETRFVIPGYIPLSRLDVPRSVGRALIHRNIEVDQAIAQRWGYAMMGPLRNRLIIPIIENNAVVCYVARSLDGSLPKETCPSGDVSNKSHFIYNLDAVQNGDGVVIVEGVFDCEAVIRAGFQCVSILGSNISDIQIGKILAKSPSKIILLLDGDEAGRKGARRAHEKFVARTHTPLFTAQLEDGKDPDDLDSVSLRRLLMPVL